MGVVGPPYLEGFQSLIGISGENDPVNLYDAQGLDALTTVANISAGIGDACLNFVTLGLWSDMGKDVRDGLGIKSVDDCSDEYKVSRAATDVVLNTATVATPGGVAKEIKFIQDWGNKGVRQVIQAKGFKQTASTALGFGQGAAGAVQFMSN